METIEFAHFAPSYCTVHAALFRDVRNSTDLLDNLKSKGASAFPLQIALVDAAYITSRQHILIAIHQALLSASREHASLSSITLNGAGNKEQGGTAPRGLRTKSIHSEVLWNLSISSNISESFRIFGVSDKTKDVIAIHITDRSSEEPEKILSQLTNIINGTLTQDGLLSLDAWRSQADSHEACVDWDKVRKVYRLMDYSERDQVDHLVTSMIAMKSVAA